MPKARILRPVTGANGHVYQVDEIVDVSDWKWARQLELQQKIKIYDDPDKDIESAPRKEIAKKVLNKEKINASNI